MGVVESEVHFMWQVVDYKYNFPVIAAMANAFELVMLINCRFLSNLSLSGMGDTVCM